jgi:hypothetical protein
MLLSAGLMAACGSNTSDETAADDQEQILEMEELNIELVDEQPEEVQQTEEAEVQAEEQSEEQKPQEKQPEDAQEQQPAEAAHQGTGVQIRLFRFARKAAVQHGHPRCLYLICGFLGHLIKGQNASDR